MTAMHHVVGIGNAIVDVLAQADDAFIVENGLAKGAMTLIDAERADRLYERMGPAVEISGGSCGNTMAGIASLGGKAGYIGKVADDQLGDVFRHDIKAIGVDFDTPPLQGLPPTARCLIVVTPDAQRTMNTYLGACVELGPEDVDEVLIKGAQVTYLEGYLWDKDRAKQAFLKAGAFVKEAGRRMSITLSDTFCVERHRESFLTLISENIDILFSNEDELKALYQTNSISEALDAVRGECEIAAITRSEKGCIVLEGANVFEVPAEPVDEVVDTTGAGDLFAAGFLHGLTIGRHPAECGRIGAIAAAEVISHIGARPNQSLAELVKSRMD